VIHASLRIQWQQKVGICGRSGSGKSTLLMALVKTTRVRSGLVDVGGTNLGSVPAGALRRCVMALPQEGALIDGTVRSNVDPHGKFTDAQVWSCLQVIIGVYMIRIYKSV
jgi:ABC-type bacteriocin/lantibiotic exporter with double-glycine peptidase domain